MKNLLFLCCLAFLLSAGCAQKKPVPRTVFGTGSDYTFYPDVLNGQVKELKEINYWASGQDDKVVRGALMTWKDLDSIGSTRNLTASFDESGYLTRYELFDENNTIRFLTELIVENGRYKRWNYTTADTIRYYFIPEYGSSGFITAGKVFRTGADTLLNSMIISNDEKGNYIKAEYFNYINEKTGTQEFTWNDRGRITKVKFFNKADSLVSTMENNYDQSDDFTSQVVTDENPKKTSVWKMTVLEKDDHGNWTRNYCVIGDGKFKLMAERTYTYY